MHLIGFVLSVVVFIPTLGRAEGPVVPGNVGDTFEITRRYETSGRTSDRRSASNSWGSDTLVERVVGVSERGLELEYDLRSDAMPEVRARTWQFPARVLKPAGGPMHLLNPADLEARVEAWREATGRTRAECERWIVERNPLRLTCDPQAVIEMLEPFDLRPADLRAGSPYRDGDARDAGLLERKANGSLAMLADVDPDKVRRERAEADVAVGEMMGKPVTLDAALGERAKEQISGTISVTFDLAADGTVRKRRKVTKVEIRRPGGQSETKVKTEIVERRRVSSHRAPPEPAG